MNLRYSLLVIALSVLILPTMSFSQVIQIGKTMEASSQLVFWYDEDGGGSGARDSAIQVTNTSDTTAVEVHIQIYSSDDTTRCLDANFNDVFTPNDTHVYYMDDLELNNGESGTDAPINSVEGTKGFVVVTPVVGAGDNTAISFTHLIGNTYVYQGGNQMHNVSAMGRDAVDLITGQQLPDGEILNGSTTGFIQIQPQEIVFNVFGDVTDASLFDVVAIVFADEYGPAGLLGYRAIPAESTWSPFLFNFAEVPGSCPQATNTCFNNWGLSAQFPAQNQLTDPGINICDAIDLESDDDGFESGWSRTFIMGLDSLENQIAVINYEGGDAGGAQWAVTR